MKEEKFNKPEMIEANRWPQNQMSVVLIILALITGCYYMIHSIFQVLDTIL